MKIMKRVPGWVWMALTIAHLAMFYLVLSVHDWEFTDSNRYELVAENIGSEVV